MARSRLFRSIVVFGSSLGAAAGFTTAGSALSAGCGLYDGTPHHGSGSVHDAGCADAHCPDAWWGFIDAAVLDGSWGTIADAPNPDAPAPAPEPEPEGTP